MRSLQQDTQPDQRALERAEIRRSDREDRRDEGIMCSISTRVANSLFLMFCNDEEYREAYEFFDALINDIDQEGKAQVAS